MRNFYALLVILFFSICILAQNGSVAPTPTDPDLSITDSNVKSPFNLPAEKRNPIKIAKFSASPNIDGKLDDEMWKSAPVLTEIIWLN